MNKTYSMKGTATPSDILTNIKDFLDLCGYEVNLSSDTVTANKKDTTDTIIIICKSGVDAFTRIMLTACSSYNGSLMNSKDLMLSPSFDSIGLYEILIDEKDYDLICNYNNNTIMISTVRHTLGKFTQHIFFGYSTRQPIIESMHFFMGGTSFVDMTKDGQLEDIATCISTNTQGIFISSQLYFAVNTYVDNAFSVERDKTIWATNHGYTELALYVSVDHTGKELPTYNVLMSKETYDHTKNVNTMNGISLCLPMYMFVIRDPRLLDEYSLIGVTSIICFVDMFNMHSGRIMDSSYPVKKNDYQCFSLGSRRDLGIIKGYNGISFKQEI